MKSKLIVQAVLMVCFLTVFTGALSAQRVELYPDAGYMWPQHNLGDGNGIKSQAVVGLKGGVFMNENSQLEGSFEYLNHFIERNPPDAFSPALGVVQPAVRGFLYDVNYAYNFGERQFLGSRISPFLSFGGGGLTAHLPDAPLTFVQSGGTSRILESGDTFFTVNYGGGVKFLNVAGPMGFRIDIRGRTLPNYFGNTTSWLEPTAGLTFSWGER
jgi:hypothetical protein